MPSWRICDAPWVICGYCRPWYAPCTLLYVEMPVRLDDTTVYIANSMINAGQTMVKTRSTFSTCTEDSLLCHHVKIISCSLSCTMSGNYRESYETAI